MTDLLLFILLMHVCIIVGFYPHVLWSSMQYHKHEIHEGSASACSYAAFWCSLQSKICSLILYDDIWAMHFLIAVQRLEPSSLYIWRTASHASGNCCSFRRKGPKIPFRKHLCNCSELSEVVSRLILPKLKEYMHLHEFWKIPRDFKPSHLILRAWIFKSLLPKSVGTTQGGITQILLQFFSCRSTSLQQNEGLSSVCLGNLTLLSFLMYSLLFSSR